jgi:hypothetical protein
MRLGSICNKKGQSRLHAGDPAAAATVGSSCTSGSSVWHRFLFIPTPPDTEKQGRLMPSDLAVLCYILQ